MSDRIKLTWHGHSCFKIEAKGHSAVIDPYTGVPGYPELSLSAGEVYTSHDHDDHGWGSGGAHRRRAGGVSI